MLTEKVDKVAGKGLSTEDYTTDEKTKLAGIAAGAEVNVQSDWNQSTDSADDYIKNKPLFNTAYNASTNKAATMSDITTSAENGTLTGYEKKTGNVAATDKIVEAIGKLETKADTNENNILSIHADWPTYAIRDNTASFTFNVPANGTHFRYGLLIGGTSADNLYFSFIYIGVNDAVTLFDVIGRASTAMSASYSNGVLTITASATIYGGLRLIWLD
jgi:hypothetical protein